MNELEERMQRLGITPEILSEWQLEEDEGFVGAGLGSLDDLARLAQECKNLKLTDEIADRVAPETFPFPTEPIVEKKV